MNRGSIVLREPWFAYDLLLFLTVLAGVYANSWVVAAAMYAGGGAGYVWLRRAFWPVRHAARSLDFARALALAAGSGMDGEGAARALAPFAPDRAPALHALLSAAGPHAPLFAPAVQSGALAPHAGAYLDQVAAWLKGAVANRDALSGSLRPGQLSSVLVPALSVFVFVGQLAYVPWAQLTAGDPLIPLVMVGMMLLWLFGLVWQHRMLERFHDGTPATKSALATALAVARAALPGADPQRVSLPAGSPTMRRLVEWAVDARGGNLPALPGTALVPRDEDLPAVAGEATLRQVGEALVYQATQTDRAQCELVALRYRMAVVLARGPAMAMAVALPMMLAASAIARVVGP